MLHFDQVCVDAAALHQFVVRTLFGDPAVLDHDDLVGAHDRAQAVRDYQRRAPLEQRTEGLLHELFRFGIECRSGLVEDQDVGVFEHRARDAEALALPADATAETTIIGKAVLIREWCLAWDKNNGCRFCYDACPYEAIELDENGRPVVVPDNCNGCGACQSVCVSQKEGSYTTGATSRAIIVVPESEA